MTETPLSADRLYAETCTQIRATDEISFKLMGLVPLVSGAALLTLFLKESVSSDKAALVVVLAMFAAVITLGLFRWELRNIQTGKTEAEKAIYCITILVWLIMPIALIGSPKLNALLPAYVCVAVLIAILTGLSVLGSVRVARTAAQAGGAS